MKELNLTELTLVEKDPNKETVEANKESVDSAEETPKSQNRNKINKPLTKDKGGKIPYDEHLKYIEKRWSGTTNPDSRFSPLNLFKTTKVQPHVRKSYFRMFNGRKLYLFQSCARCNKEIGFHTLEECKHCSVLTETEYVEATEVMKSRDLLYLLFKKNKTEV